MKNGTMFSIFMMIVLSYMLYPLASEGQENYFFMAKWGEKGNDNEEFDRPKGIAVDGTGNVYVADTNNDRIQKFKSNGEFLREWGIRGTENRQFDEPTDVTVDGSGNVYVIDTENHRVQKFTSSGRFLAKWGTEGDGDGQFSEPEGITVDDSGNVYVADTENHRIQKFTSNGSFLTKWGTEGDEDGEFDGPAGIAADASGNVYVADAGNNRIQRFTSNGVVSAKWEEIGTTNQRFHRPKGVAVDSSGAVYVADSSKSRILKFTSDGDFLVGWGIKGPGDGQIIDPEGVAVDRSGYVYVADQGNYRIQRFTPNPPPEVSLSRFSEWERGILTVGTRVEGGSIGIRDVLFQYNLAGGTWSDIDLVRSSPYTVNWDTTSIAVHGSVGIKATAANNDGLTGEDDRYFGVDNEPPTTSDDYDGEWRRADFYITLEGDDGSGSGEVTIKYRINDGDERTVSIHGQPKIDREKSDNKLEYWGIDNVGNVEEHNVVYIRLDRTEPVFSDRNQEPAGLTEFYQGTLHVEVKVTDEGGSGILDAPSYDYRIGIDARYDGYEPMTTNGDDKWYFDIVENWSEHAGKTLYYKVQAFDAAGNEATSEEYSVSIVPVHPPVVEIASEIKPWENGVLAMEARATDADGRVVDVLFQYSLDSETWDDVIRDTTSPYTADWDTTSVIPVADDSVWVRAIATDNEGLTGEYVTDVSFGVDNKLPTTTDDYDGKWHNRDFYITLVRDDKAGSGIASTNYKINDGPEEKSVSKDGHPRISIQRADNKLEYWSIDKAGNEEEHHIIPDIKLDKTKPSFSKWKENPRPLTSLHQGVFRVAVEIVNPGGSEISGDPSLDYHIGNNTGYIGYKPMTNDGNRWWHFDIEENWNADKGRVLYYRVKASDVAGNIAESPERTMPIEVKVPPEVKITSECDEWESGKLRIEAVAEGKDGRIVNVRFQYSLDSETWHDIATDENPPYLVESWDTTLVIETVDDGVWLRATATDDLGLEGKDETDKSFGLDNELPTANDNYNHKWHNEPIIITLTANDRVGSGIESINYKINNSARKSVLADGQPRIATEGDNNKLEYWAVDNVGNEGDHNVLAGIKLDKTKPVFSEWDQKPEDLTQLHNDAFHVRLRVTDDRSGILGGPLLGYVIADGRMDVISNTDYDYEPMTSAGGDVWYFDITENWGNHAGETLYYKVQVFDVAGNIAESKEHKELITEAHMPVVVITNQFKPWERGKLRIEAKAEDPDGQVQDVLFQYSLDGSEWYVISTKRSSTSLYTPDWDTTSVIPVADDSVWVKAVATDNDGLTGYDITDKSFGVDNEPPTTEDDYDRKWCTTDFVVILKGSDKSGSGIESINYKLNDDEERTVFLYKNPRITTEGANNKLEYWSVDRAGNEETPHHVIYNIKLDKTKPAFSSWVEKPEHLTQLYVGEFHVRAKVTDSGGSGISGEPLFGYHIGDVTNYSDYEAMTNSGDDVWYFDVTATWSDHADKKLYYRVQVFDAAGNMSEEERIAPITRRLRPEVKITTTPQLWDSGVVEVKATARDPDPGGRIVSVLFRYSLAVVYVETSA